MGIFSKQKKIEKELKECAKKNRNTGIILSEINESTIVQYTNGDRTKIVRAKALIDSNRRKKNDTKEVNYIAFEIREDQELTLEIMNEALAEYEREKAIEEYEKIYYLGRCLDSKYGYYFSQMSKQTEDIITEIIKEEERTSKPKLGIIYQKGRKTNGKAYRESLNAERTLRKLKSDSLDSIPNNQKMQEER